MNCFKNSRFSFIFLDIFQYPEHGASRHSLLSGDSSKLELQHLTPKTPLSSSVKNKDNWDLLRQNVPNEFLHSPMVGQQEYQQSHSSSKDLFPFKKRFVWSYSLSMNNFTFVLFQVLEDNPLAFPAKIIHKQIHHLWGRRSFWSVWTIKVNLWLLCKVTFHSRMPVNSVCRRYFLRPTRPPKQWLLYAIR